MISRPSKRYKRIVILLLGVCLVFSGAAYLFLRHPAVQNTLAQSITRWLGLPLEARRIGLDLNQGLAVKLENVNFQLPGGEGRLQIPSLLVGLKLAPLLRGQIAPDRIILVGPSAVLGVPPAQRPPPPAPVASPGEEPPPFGGRLLSYLPKTLERLRVTRGTLQHSGMPFQVHDLDLDLQIQPADQPVGRIRAVSTLKGPRGAARVGLAGRLMAGEGLAGLQVEDLRLDLDQLPLLWFPWPQFLPCESGRASGQLVLEGDLEGKLIAHGRLDVEGLRLILKLKGRRHVYDHPRLPLEIQTSWEKGRWRIFTRSPERDILPVEVDWLWDFTTKPKPAMDLTISGGFMPLETFKALYPAPVTTAWLDQQLFPALSGGTLALREFRLHGRLDQLKQLKDPLHRHRLKLELDVRRTTVFQDRPGLPLEEVGAHVLIDQGVLRIDGLSGGFRGSRIEEADFGIPDLYRQPLILEGVLQGNFRLEDLKDQVPAPWFSASGRKLFAPLAVAEGPLKAAAGFSIRCTPPLKTTLWGTFDVGPSHLQFTALETPLELEAGRLVLNADGQAGIDLHARLAESDFTLSGSGQLDLANASNAVPPDWRARVQGIFDLAGLLAGRNRELLQTRWPAFNAGLETVEGVVAADFAVEKGPGAAGPRIVDGWFQLHGGCAEWRPSPWPVAVGTGTLTLQPGGSLVVEGTGLWGPNQWALEGQVDASGDPSRRTLALVVDAQGDLTQVADVLLPRLPVKVFASAPSATRMKLLLAGRELTIEGHTDLVGLKVAHGGFEARLTDPQSRAYFHIQRPAAGQYRIPQIALQSGASRIDLKGWLNFPEQDMSGFVEITADCPELKELQLRAPTVTRPVEGRLSSRTAWRVDSRGLHPIGPAGHIRISGLNLSTSKLPAAIRDSTADFHLSGDGLQIDSDDLRIGESILDIQGRFTGWAPLKGALDVQGQHIRVRDFYSPPPRGSVMGPIESPALSARRLPAWLSEAEVQAAVHIESLLDGDLAVGPLDARFKLGEDSLSLQRAVISLRPGVFIVSGQIPAAIEDNLQFGGYLQTENTPIETLLPAFGVDSQRLAARLNLEGSYLAQGRSKAQLIGGLDGNFSLELTEGTVQNSTVLLRILDLLSLQNIILKRVPEVGQDAFFFEKMTADIEIRQGVAATDNFIMRSPVFNAAGRGRADLVRRTIDFDMGAQPLGSVDSLVSRIPVVGHILTGPEKSLLVYYFHVNGPWQKPQVQYVPFKNLGKGLVGYFERIFTTPPRLLRKAAQFTRAFLGFDQTDIGDQSSREGSGDPELPRDGSEE